MKIGDRIYVHGYVDEIRKDCVIIRNEGGYFGTVKSEIVEAQKAEDIVSVIRCKDCKHAEREDDGDIMCTFWDFCECNHHVLANGYCDRAERRKDDRRQNNTV